MSRQKPLPSGKRIFTGGLDQMAGVIEGEDSDVSRAAEFEVVYAAIRCDYPRSCLGAAMDSSEEKER